MIGGMCLRHVVALIALATIGYLLRPTLIKAQAVLPTAPALLVRFDGGDEGANLSRVLSFLVDADRDRFPTSKAAVTTSICATLASAGYPPPCGDFSTLVDKLNGPGTFSDALELGTFINIPSISIQETRNTRVVKTSDGLFERWKWLNSRLLRIKGNQSVISYDSYQIVYPVASDGQADSLAGDIGELGLLNIAVEPLLQKPIQTKLYSLKTTADTVEHLCESHESLGTIYYDDLSDVTLAEKAALQAQDQITPVQATPVYVTLIDTNMMKAPNLDSRRKGTAGWSCTWEAFSDRDHATHLAGIIGSEANGYGFVGLAPQVKWDPFIWEQSNAAGDLTASPLRTHNLVQFLDDRSDMGGALHIYVAALSFDPYPAGMLDQFGSLRSSDERFVVDPGRAIDNDSPLLVVSAGQVEPDGGNYAAPQMLTPSTALSPQNLGDRPYVVVVTACSDCSRAHPILLSTANYGDPENPIVQLVAPGAQPIPGWITDHSVGAAGGTSQAAAYVAGVAASMISRYPFDYTLPRKVKERLQATAWPLPVFTESGQKNPDAKRVSSGLVDPALALLDPNKVWGESFGQWKPLAIQSLDGVAFLDDQDLTAPVLNNYILRMIKYPDMYSPNHWVVYEDRSHCPPNIGGYVKKFTELHPSTTSYLTTCDGKKHMLSDYTDILLPIGGVGASSCPQ